MPAAVGAAQVVAQLLSWSYLMPSYDTTLTGSLPLQPLSAPATIAGPSI